LTTYSFPSLTPNNTEWRLISNTAAFGDPLTGVVQTLSRPGARWAVTMSFTALDADDRATLQAFLIKLRGQENRASIYDHSHTQRGNLGGTPVVNGGSQTGTSLVTSGWSGDNPVIRAGDYFTVNGELKMVTADANHTAGAATISFEPALRASPTNGAALTVSNPTATFMLSGNDVGWSNRPASFSGFTIEFVEAFT